MKYTIEHQIEYPKLDRISKDIILDYIWEDMESMDKIRQWIKDVYED